MNFRPFFILAALLIWQNAHAQGRCVDLFLKSLPLPATVDNFFHNLEVRDLLAGGVSSSSLEKLSHALTEHNALYIPVTGRGFVAAANVGSHHGGYGRFLWFRDFARVQQGLSKLPEVLGRANPQRAEMAREVAAKVRQAQLELLADPLWTEQAIRNIEDVTLHLEPQSGFRSVIWIRRLLDPIVERRSPTKEELDLESQWGHKQNDALAVFANSFLDVLKKNELRASAVPENARINMLLLASYFVRLKFWKMWDVGAWEEGMGQRTSSIAMVTSYLERMSDGLYGPKSGVERTELDIFFSQLRENSDSLLRQRLSAEALVNVQELLRPERLESAIDKAYALIHERLLDPTKPIIEAKNSDPMETRFEDTALMHLFWHPLKRLNAREEISILDRLALLERPSGYIRYAADWFLYGSAQVAINGTNLHRFGELAVPDGKGSHRKATSFETTELLDAYSVKNMERVLQISGKGLEAQWTLPDSYLTQIYADAYIRWRNPEYLARAKKHFLRISGLITGKGEFNSEGHPVEAWRLPEAYVPATFIQPNGLTRTVYLVSPNSPLNWSTAEYIMALGKMREAVALSEKE